MPLNSRRSFLQGVTSAVGTGLLLAPFSQVAKAQASERVRVGIMGAGGRGPRVLPAVLAGRVFPGCGRAAVRDDALNEDELGDGEFGDGGLGT